ncbi:glycosyltransferase family 2 protein [Marinicella sp. W31]|uniref:glycosyltransferase family 2 protein n=1 Tax=Marinicella sp. W31 TaxID=3023713 RepID=UPI003757E8C2
MTIEIVVPVYNAYDAFVECLQSLQKHNAHSRVIFINDASTDERIAEILRHVETDNWIVVTNQVNLGFVKTANIGLRRTTGPTVLLNSDTVVTNGWLQRMLDCLQQQKAIGTITPWSNNAEICSFPENLQYNQEPEKPDVLAGFLYQYHRPEYPHLPTAVGFCMLVSAEAKKQVGFFDEEQFGMGYGEENDYSLRVTAAGLHNVLCDNAYVIHKGNQSFQELKLAPSEETMRRLLDKHPDYQRLIEIFIQQNPLADLRTRLIEQLKKHKPELYRVLI